MNEIHKHGMNEQQKFPIYVKKGFYLCKIMRPDKTLIVDTWELAPEIKINYYGGLDTNEYEEYLRGELESITKDDFYNQYARMLIKLNGELLK